MAYRVFILCSHPTSTPELFLIQLFHFSDSGGPTPSGFTLGIPIAGCMMTRLKASLMAIAGLLVANLADAREASHTDDWFARQEQFIKRIEARDRRATRSICEDLCKESKRSVYAEPEELLESGAVAEATYERARTPYQMQFGTDAVPDESE